MTIKHQYLIILLFSLTSIMTFANGPYAIEGQVAPDFDIIQMDGSRFKLSDYRGQKSVYLVFWNTWCGYCINKIPKLKKAQTDLSDRIKIIAINTSLKDSVAQLLIFQQHYNINYSLAFDRGKKITDLYDVWGTPTEFIIDINGIIQHQDEIPQDLSPLLSQWNTVSVQDKNCNNKAVTC